MKKLILAIESSCDDSSIAIIDRQSYECLFHKKISQELEHAKFGGVVPELAARLHTTALPQILDECKGYFNELCAVAVTSEPGLSVSLLGGITMAKILSLSLNVPLIAVNHLIGHIYSLFLTEKARFDMGVLLVSGGHTMLVRVDEVGEIHILAQTTDDSFGESFDKVAKMLNLGYPGGALIEKLAQKANVASEKVQGKTSEKLKTQTKMSGKANKQASQSLHFPVPLKHSKELAFSFSGLKNAVRVKINENANLSESQKSQIAFAFEEAAVAHLMDKTAKLFETHKFKHFGIVGGASANLKLRAKMNELCQKYECELKLAPLEFCADNALMIARAACSLYERGEFVSIQSDIMNPKNKHFFRL